MYQIIKNDQFNSNEIYFDSIPPKAVRESLKAIGCRWHNAKKCWYTRKDEDQIKAAIEGKAETKPAEVANEYGVKVGDVFQMSWGYDQTNNDFFQVVGVTAKKVRIVEVAPSYTTEWATAMAEDRKLTFKEGEMLPRVERSLWINDNENGDLKSVRDYSRDKNDPQIVISGRGHYSA